MRVRIFASSEFKPDFFSRRIMSAIKASYSHVGFIIEIDDQWARRLEVEGPGTYIVHSVEKGVCIEALAPFAKDHEFAYDIDITDLLEVPIEYLLGWFDGMRGTRYAWGQILGYLLPIEKIRLWLSNGQAEVYCSEFGGRGFEKALQIDLWNEFELDYLSPRDFIDGALIVIDALKGEH